MIELKIPLKITSLNFWISCHWTRRKKEADMWNDIIYYIAAKENVRFKFPPMVKKKVAIISMRNRLIDMDNLIGGFKMGRDALVKNNFLKDDSPKWCEFEYSQVKVKKKDEITIIRIEDI